MTKITLSFVSFLALVGFAAAIAQESKPAAESATTEVRPKVAPLHEHPTLVAMWRRNNELRASMGQRPMAMSAILTQAAQDHAWFMAASGQFSHESNGGMVSRVRKYGGGHGSLRENIAWNQRGVAECFQDWQNSPGHWSNITSGEAEVGFGYAIGANGQTYWVAVFGTP